MTSLLGFSQIKVPGDFHNPIDKINDTTTLAMYSSTTSVDDGLRFNNVMFKTSHNNKYARGYNDGPVWKGEGLTLELHGGFSGKSGNLTYTLNPAIFLSENSGFPTPNLPSSVNIFGYQYSTQIDWVMRYGNKPFHKFHLGQSEVRLNFGKFFTSIGTQNYSVGPSTFNPILMSRQGAGFPHLILGVKPTYLSAKKNIGKLEANLMYGLLKESDYYDDNSSNDNRYFNAMFIAFSPSFLPELTIGFNKVLYKQTRFFQNQDLLSMLFIIDNGVINGDTLSQNDTFDQMASFTVDWNFQEVGFRVYLEFAKNDFTSDGGGIRPTAVEPEHSRGYTIGFEKILLKTKEKKLLINYEHTNLSYGHKPWRGVAPFYAHSVNRQGYTHDGQLIGAGIGPGGNSDHFNVLYKKEYISSFLLIQRIERDRDYFVNQIRNSNLHDIEYSITAGVQKQYEKYDLFIEGSLNYNYSRYYLLRDRSNRSFGFGGRLKL